MTIKDVWVGEVVRGVENVQRGQLGVTGRGTEVCCPEAEKEKNIASSGRMRGTEAGDKQLRITTHHAGGEGLHKEVSEMSTQLQ